MPDKKEESGKAIATVKEKALNGKGVVSIQQLVEKSASELGKALPAHMRPERIVRIALTTLRLNPKLYQCDPYSFLGALFQCAQLGLEPNVEGQAYIIPYQDRKNNRLVAQFQIGYKGYVDLFWRHESALDIRAEKVCEKDHFQYDLGENKLSHIPPAFGIERGKTIGYYAIAHLRGGGMTFKVMSREEALAFGKQFSKCYDRKEGKFFDGTPWAEHFDAMAMKTVLKQLLKTLPKSVEIQHALSMDETVKTRIDSDMVQIPNEADYSTDPEQEALPAPTSVEGKENTEKSPAPSKEDIFGQD